MSDLPFGDLQEKTDENDIIRSLVTLSQELRGDWQLTSSKMSDTDLAEH